MLESLTATRFAKAFSTGRTQPLLLTCEDSLGEEHDIVVKLSGNKELPPGGLLFEGFASLLAAHLNLPVSQSYIINVTKEFAESVIAPEHRQVALDSVGPNFGTRFWKSGYSIWPTERRVPKNLLSLAGEVFAFDGIIQNPDRGGMKPNCAYKENKLILFDHELAFSHFLNLAPSLPWERDSLRFLNKHLFRPSLKDKPLDLTRFEAEFRSIDRGTLEAYVDLIPSEWRPSYLQADSLPNYLLSCIENFDDIKIQLETELR